MQHHHLGPNDAQIVEDNMGTVRTSYRVYRPDGMWAKLDMTFPTRPLAEEYCADNGWNVR